MLNFAKLEAGRVQFAIARVSMHDIFLGVEALVLPQLHAKGLRYVDAGEYHDILVHADEEKARQVLINLLSNAVKFTPAGGEIRLACTVDDEWVHASVSDSGVGIPLDRLDAIFEPFVQVDRGLTSRQEERDSDSRSAATSRVTWAESSPPRAPSAPVPPSRSRCRAPERRRSPRSAGGGVPRRATTSIVPPRTPSALAETRSRPGRSARTIASTSPWNVRRSAVRMA